MDNDILNHQQYKWSEPKIRKPRQVRCLTTLNYLFLCITLLSSCSPDNTSFDTDISVPVSVSEVKYGSIEQYINTTGSVYAMQEVTLNSEMTGNYTLLKNPKTGKQFRACE